MQSIDTPVDLSPLSSLQMAHSLEHLYVGISAEHAIISPLLCQIFQKSPRLKSFHTTRSLDDTFVRGISRNRNLEELRCGGFLELNKDATLISPSFPSLRELSAKWQNLDDFTYFLGQTDSTTFRSLSVSLQSSMEMGQLQNFLTTVNRKGFGASLSVLTIGNEYLPKVWPSETDLTAYKLSPDLLLHTFCNLTELHIPHSCQVGDCGFVFDEFALDSLARAFPHIEELWLHDVNTSPCISCDVTLQALKAFAEHCPKLEVLAIHVNARTVPAGILHGFDPKERCPLKKLVLDGSPITESPNDQAAIAYVLYQLFPSLENMHYLVGWENVEGYVESFRKLSQMKG